MLRASGNAEHRSLVAEARRAEQRLVRSVRQRDAARAIAGKTDTERARAVLRAAEQSVDARECNADEAWDKVWKSDVSVRGRRESAADVVWMGHAPKDKELLVACALNLRMAIGIKYTEWQGTDMHARITTTSMLGEGEDGVPRTVSWQTTRWEKEDGTGWIDVWVTVWWGIARTSFEMRVELDDGPRDEKQATREEKERQHWERFRESLGKEDEELAKFLDALVRRAHYSYLTSGLYRGALQKRYPQCVWPGVDRSAK